MILLSLSMLKIIVIVYRLKPLTYFDIKLDVELSTLYLIEIIW